MPQTAKQIVVILNEMLRIDRAATSCLVLNKVPCNAAMERHPLFKTPKRAGVRVAGVMSIVNAIVAADGDQIDADYDSHGTLKGFKLRKKEGVARDTAKDRGHSQPGPSGGPDCNEPNLQP